MAGLSNFGDKKAAPFGKKKAAAKAVVRSAKKGKKWTKASDDAWDKAHGVKEGSARDKALDAKRGVSDMSVSGRREIDLDWATWDAQHGKGGSGAQQQAKAPKPKQSTAGLRKPGWRPPAANQQIKNFKAANGISGKGHHAELMADLKSRAAAGGLRAKEILAAENGHAKRANRLQKLRIAKLTAARAKEQSKGAALSNEVNLSTLSAAERKALPAGAFVFPSKRAYPIHDLAHARDALARSSGKPEAGAVRAAVYAKYPNLAKSK